MLKLSYSSISTFMNCRRMYYFGYIKRIQPNVVNKNFIIGDATHFGLNLLFSGDKLYARKTKEHYQEIVDKARKMTQVTPEQEQELIEGKIVVLGMLKGYSSAHNEFLKTAKQISNEKEFLYNISEDVQIYGKIDNVIKIKNKIFLHELKTSRYLTVDYVKNMQGALQPLIYLYYNNIFEKKKANKFSGVIYDVMRKPSIRCGKNEGYPQFLERLEEYYMDPTKQNELYYQEIIEQPRLQKDDIINTVNNVVSDIKKCECKNDYYQNFNFCSVKYRCSYWSICHMNMDENNQQYYISRDKT